jgi:hypothetical protein
MSLKIKDKQRKPGEYFFCFLPLPANGFQPVTFTNVLFFEYAWWLLRIQDRTDDLWLFYSQNRSLDPMRAISASSLWNFCVSTTEQTILCAERPG